MTRRNKAELKETAGS